MSGVFFHHGALLLPDGQISENSWLLTRDDKIAAFGDSTIAPPLLSAEVDAIDLAGALLMPGLINSHTHAAMTLFRGLADDLPLMEWLNDYIFPTEKHLVADWVKWGTLLAAVEMIRGGTTTFADMYLFSEAAAEAAAASGLRAVIGEVLYDFPSICYGEPENGLRHTRDFIAKWRHHPTVHPIVNAHAIYTCSPDLLRASHAIAVETDTLLHIHVAENEQEVAIASEKYGTRPFTHLANLGLADSRLLAAHAVYLDEREIALAAERQVKIAHCPISNLKLVSGVAPIPAMLKQGITVGLGTDGCASNNNLDMFNTLKTAAILHKWQDRNTTTLPAKQVIAMATDARVLGLEKIIGKIEVGMTADLIAIDFSAPNLRPCYHRESHLVYAANPENVKHSMVNGKMLMRNRRLLTLEESEIFARVEEISAKIRR